MIDKNQETLDDYLFDAWISYVSRLAELIYETILPHVEDTITAFDIQRILKDRFGINASLKDIDEALHIIACDSDFNPINMYELYEYNGHHAIKKVIKLPHDVNKEISELMSP